MTIRTQESQELTRAHGLDLKLLQPWPGVDTPFHGAWCVLRPGDVSEGHAHREREIFIAMSGRAEVVTGERRQELVAGDLATIGPEVQHSIVNPYDEDFAYYAIWWDRTTAAEYLGLETGTEQSA